MASPKEMLKGSIKVVKPTTDRDADDLNCGNGTIEDLVAKAFATRNLVHFAHWNTNSYASHMALGDLYEEIIDSIDELVECYQGKFGLLKGLRTGSAVVPTNILAHVQAEADWIDANRCGICKGIDALESLLDIVSSQYLRTIYKLQNLH